MSNDSKFDYAINVILNHEGGLVDNPSDPGGLTNFGLTIHFILDNKIRDDYESARYLLTSLINRDIAEEIYKHYIWDKYHYTLLESLEIPTKVFDMNTNLGAHESHMLLQEAINNMAREPVLVDGIMGIHTINAANNLPSSYLHQELRELQKCRYIELVHKNPELECFLEAWINRAQW